MKRTGYFRGLRLKRFLGTGTRALAKLATFVLVVILTQSARAQTFTVLYNFTAAADGYSPVAGLTIDNAGNLYGDTDRFTVFEFSHKQGGWIFNTLYTFTGVPDGAFPAGRVIFGADGSLYGATSIGGLPNCADGSGCGTVFSLRPPTMVCTSVQCSWPERVLYRFVGQPDGQMPEGDVAFDSFGNLYGTTYYGGQFGQGSAYQLHPSNGGWVENVIYSFGTLLSDGTRPMTGSPLIKLGISMERPQWVEIRHAITVSAAVRFTNFHAQDPAGLSAPSIRFMEQAMAACLSEA